MDIKSALRRWAANEECCQCTPNASLAAKLQTPGSRTELSTQHARSKEGQKLHNSLLLRNSSVLRSSPELHLPCGSPDLTRLAAVCSHLPLRLNNFATFG
jgi:hypothetical protein